MEPNTDAPKPVRNTPSKSESKAEATTAAARSILDAEVTAREAKTARLRAARIKAETKAAAIETETAPAAPKRKAAAGSRARR